MLKRSFDVVFSILGLITLSPILLVISLLIKLDSKGPVLFMQGRVGKDNVDFDIYKFRTMRVQSDKKGLLTLGNNDARITKIGYFLRRYKIDEFPQLINIIKGDMSFVGPRPELRYYVNFYNENDMSIFKVRPGITGLASLKYRNEVELLKAAKGLPDALNMLPTEDSPTEADIEATFEVLFDFAVWGSEVGLLRAALTEEIQAGLKSMGTSNTQPLPV